MWQSEIFNNISSILYNKWHIESKQTNEQQQKKARLYRHKTRVFVYPYSVHTSAYTAIWTEHMQRMHTQTPTSALISPIHTQKDHCGERKKKKKQIEQQQQQQKNVLNRSM